MSGTTAESSKHLMNPTVERLITFEIYHRTAVKLGFSLNRAHSRLMWILFSYENYGNIEQFLPSGELANFTVRVFLLPTGVGGMTLRMKYASDYNQH